MWQLHFQWSLMVCKWLLSFYMCREILSVCNLQVMQSKDHFVMVWPTEKWLCTSRYSSWIQYMDIICGEPIVLWSVKLLAPQFTSSKNPGTNSCKTISTWQTPYALSLILIRIYPYSPSLYVRTLVDVLLKRVIWISTTGWFIEPVHKFGNLVLGTFLSVLLLYLQEISRRLSTHIDIQCLDAVVCFIVRLILICTLLPPSTSRTNAVSHQRLCVLWTHLSIIYHWEVLLAAIPKVAAEFLILFQVLAFWENIGCESGSKPFLKTPDILWCKKWPVSSTNLHVFLSSLCKQKWAHVKVLWSTTPRTAFTLLNW